MDAMKKSKPRRKRDDESMTARTVMVIPAQSADEIWRRREIREALHDLKAKTIRGKR
jgi:hypothetical protein